MTQGPASHPPGGAWLAIRKEPFRLFFPLGAILGGIGVWHWLAYTVHVQAHYSGETHALVQVQAFLLAFASGFLLTMLQRRAGGVLASSLVVVSLATALVAIAVLAMLGQWALSQLAYLGVLALLAGSALRLARQAGASGRPPRAFVLVPIGFAQGAAGAILIICDSWLDGGWATSLGRSLVQEGFWICLALGVGHLILPTITGQIPHASRGGLLAHGLVGVAIAASFVLQHVVEMPWGGDARVRLGTGLRGSLVAWELAACMGAWRWPRTAGTHRKLAWISFWMVPLGLLLAAGFPAHHVGLLHVTFVSGFSLMTFAVAAHVIAAHGGFDELLSRSSWIVRLVGGLVLLAAVTRVAADFLPEAYWPHIGIAAATWLVALGAWMLHLLPKALRPRRREEEADPPQFVELERPVRTPPRLP